MLTGLLKESSRKFFRDSLARSLNGAAFILDFFASWQMFIVLLLGTLVEIGIKKGMKSAKSRNFHIKKYPLFSR